MGRAKRLQEPELKKMKAWVRAKTFRAINSIKTELGIPVYFAVHGLSITEVHLYGAFPAVDQGNLHRFCVI
ncbi:hypothetical protein D9758_012706 [Tetrapyrgos nigripes]|uniref:Uncharacterized protein n=1 Tax=Tetrapyrgos nigripes TaxID=182062 RepID=A0A8H5FTY0_9AGAR|nr:hypothetical protein D9758_012706 [Tetrapyrgos nigripes]